MAPVERCTFTDCGVGVWDESGKARISDSEFTRNGIGVLYGIPALPAELLAELRALADSQTPPDKIEAGVLERFSAAGLNILDLVGRGLTLLQIVQFAALASGGG